MPAPALPRPRPDRRPAPAAAPTSEQRYRGLLDSLDQGYCLVEVLFAGDTPDDFRILEVNAAFEGLTGLRDPVGGTMRGLMPRHDQHSLAVYGRVARTGRPERFVRQARYLGGQWYDVCAFPVGGHVGVLFADVTARKAAEAALQDAVARLEATLSAGEIGTWTWDVPAARIVADRNLARMFGVTAEVAGGGPMEAYTAAIHPDDRDRVTRQLLRVLESGDVYETEYRTVVDGRVRSVIARGRVERDAAGRAARLPGVVIDVTGQRRAEAELFASREALRAVLDAIPQRVFWKGPDLTYLGCNRQFARDMGFESPEQVAGTDDFAGPWAEMAEAFRADDRRVIDSGQPKLDYEEVLVAADGSRQWVRTSKQPLRGPDGRVVGVLGTYEDVTARHVLEEKLRQSQKMDAFGQLAGGVAHDFNNMLQVINGYADLIVADLPAGDRTARLVGEIRKAGERSAALTRQLLAFARQQVADPKVLDPSAAAADMVGMLRRLIGADVRLATDLPASVWPVLADPGQVEQVLLNLAVNARDAMPGGGTLTVSTRNETVGPGDHPDAAPGPHAVLSVTDTGTGMPPEVLARVFEPFFTTKGVGKGTGLGLATVYGIVKQAGGHVRVRSAPGAGTTFAVYLPRVERAAADGPAAGAARPLPCGSETVLVVEDEAAVRGLVTMVLAGCGYDVLEAADGDAAERAAAGHAGPLHLVVSDVVMPGAGGRAAVAGVTARHPGAKVLYMSGYTDDAVVRQGVSAADVPFLQKPFTPAVLAAKVRQVLDALR